MIKFRCLNEATKLYQLAKKQRLKVFMKDQLLRASSSLREVQMICQFENLNELEKQADILGAMIYALNRNLTDTVHCQQKP